MSAVVDAEYPFPGHPVCVRTHSNGSFSVACHACDYRSKAMPRKGEARGAGRNHITGVKHRHMVRLEALPS